MTLHIISDRLAEHEQLSPDIRRDAFETCSEGLSFAAAGGLVSDELVALHGSERKGE